MTENNLVATRAVDSQRLSNRSDSNRAYSTSNFDGWLSEIFQSLRFRSVLDMCCGTGNQLVLYRNSSEVETIVGTDISDQSLATARERLGELEPRCRLVRAEMDEVLEDPALQKMRFDLISCVYGLYYATNVVPLMSDMIDHLAPDGTILVVGPYGENNRTLYDLLERHLTIPHPVLRSTSTFMEQEVIPTLSTRLPVRTETFVNRIVYPSTDAVMRYWQATTFYDAPSEEDVRADVERHVEAHGEFTVEKHVMAVIAGGSGA
jgi:ubiquinone/menaquinone biosynthesis C-methylase UbiE